MNCKELQICEICMEEKCQFKNGENCIHPLCNECFDACQKCNNKCPMCRSELSKELKKDEDEKKSNTFWCYHCGDECDEDEYEYIVEREDDIQLCVYCYNDFGYFTCNNCDKECKYFQLCVHGVACNDDGCCVCEECQHR